MALPVPPEAAAALRTRVEAAARRVGSTDADAIRLVDRESYHLTLRFLGATDPARLAALARAVREAALAASPFRVELGSVVALGGGRGTALVCEVAHGAEAVAAIAGDLDAALASRGWSAEARPFRPHLTVARGRHAAMGRGFGALSAAVTGAGIGWVAERIVVYESQLGSGRPRYLARAAASLGRSDGPDGPRSGRSG